MRSERGRNLRVAGIGLLLVGLIGAHKACEQEAELPRLAELPDFALTDQHGASVRLGDLQGGVWVANFIFTSCPDVCPLLTQQMVLLRRRTLADGLAVRYVSFSVDPATDTPEVLAQFARKHRAVFDDWSFVTGPLDGVKGVVVRGFHQSMEPSEVAGEANVLHGTHFVLVDREGTIRGYYESDERGLVQLAHDAARLQAEPG